MMVISTYLWFGLDIQNKLSEDIILKWKLGLRIILITDILVSSYIVCCPLCTVVCAALDKMSQK